MTVPPLFSKSRSHRIRRWGFTIVESLIMLLLVAVMTILILSLIRYHGRDDDQEADAETVPRLSADGSIEKSPEGTVEKPTEAEP